MAHWHPRLILSRLSCGCKSALISRHLVPALSRAERARPGGSWLETGREGNQAPRCSSQGPSIISKAGAVLTGHPVPGVCARLSRAANHEEPGAWSGESGQEPGCRCRGQTAEGWFGDRDERAAGSIPKAFSSLLKGLVTVTAAVGPLSAAGKGIGEALFKSEVPIQRQPMPAHLVATGPPLTQSPSATGHTAPSREAGISRRGLGPSRRVPG